ncbi:MAG TPA: BrxA/BrxB family bacilliredoxin [Pyrinomonadaceae bacterium]|nr:BrxA/BrxB family bacilliredoxin [Pyrinomonadaceae bacterium]
MQYPEIMIRPMREELTRLGVEELRSAEQVDEAVANSKGTLMIIVNSICGCAAGKARPGVALALQHNPRPDKVATVFAGGDIEATERARDYFKGYPPSSPSIAILKDGELVYMLERRQIENRMAPDIAQELTAAFDKFCNASTAATN